SGRPTGVLHGLTSSTHVFVDHPSYTRIANLSLAARVSIMSEPAFKAALLQEESTTGIFSSSRVARYLKSIYPLGEQPDYEPDESASIAAMAAVLGTDAMGLMYDMLIAYGGCELFYQPFGLFENNRFDYFERAISHPDVIFG